MSGKKLDHPSPAATRRFAADLPEGVTLLSCHADRAFVLVFDGRVLAARTWLEASGWRKPAAVMAHVARRALRGGS